MQVYLNELCLKTDDLYKLDDYVDVFDKNKIKHIFYSPDIEKRITDQLTDDNELTLLLTVLEKLQNKAKIYREQFEENENYFVPICSEENPQLINVKLTSIAKATEVAIDSTNEMILLLHLSDNEFNQNGFCHILYQDRQKQTSLIKLPIIDTTQKIHLFLGLDFIKQQRREEFESLEKQQYYKEAQQKALSFDFSKCIYNETNLLPLKAFSDFIVPSKYEKDWEKWGKDVKLDGKGAVNAANIAFGDKVATINGYIFNERVTKLNEKSEHKREIYDVGQSRDKIYLSIEFEKPFTFEVFNFSGKHIGELNYGGKLKEQDKHILIVK